jgi:hypothetical protein
VPRLADGGNARADSRANVFLAGMLHCSGGAFPVRIRNLSPDGALVEGGVLPDVGHAVRLERGPYTVAARVAWRSYNCCGLHYSTPIQVEKWIRYGTASAEQQRVDALMACARASPGPSAAPAEPAKPAHIDCVQAAAEIEAICEHLREASEGLAAEPEIVVLAQENLQRLDIAMTQLARLAQRLRAPH